MLRRIALLLLLAAPALAQAPAGPPMAAGHAGPVQALAVLPRGEVVSGGADGRLLLWPADLAAPRPPAGGADGGPATLSPVLSLVALPGGGFASGAQDGALRLWPEPLGEAPPLRHDLPGGAVAALAAAGEALLTGSADGTAQLWRPGRPPRRLEGHRGRVAGAAFRSDGLPVTAGIDGTVLGWPEEGGPLLLAGFGTPLAALVALPGGLLAAAGADGLVRLVPSGPAGAPPAGHGDAPPADHAGAPPAATGRHFEAGRGPLAALAASADGSLLAAAGPGGGISVWSLPEGRLRHSLASAGGAVWSLAFSPDAALLYAGGADGRPRAVDLQRGVTLGPAAAGPAGRPARPAAIDMEGARVFRGCGGCHSLAAPPGGVAELKAGPHLARLFGRPVAGVPGYAYSGALARSGGVWTKQALADLLSGGAGAPPVAHLPPAPVVGETGDLAALLRFLEQATKD
jgi:cytochrome c